MTTIFWFRRDLRLHDNAGLFHALNESETVLPIFIFDTNILSELPKDDARVTFISQYLDQMNADLKKHKTSLAVFHDTPEKVFGKLIAENEIGAVYTNHDYEPYATKRDSEIGELLSKHHIEFKTFKDQLIFEKSDVVKDDGKPYVVYTPYANKWKQKFRQIDLEHFKSDNFLNKLATHKYPFLNLKAIGFDENSTELPKFDLSESLIEHYEARRNFPAIHGTSRLSVHLRFGTVSIREAVRKASAASNNILLNELIWRELFMQILWHFPHTVDKSFKPEYDRIKWRYDEADFKKWCDGKTGFPLVDAGMRQLNSCGYMHNRVRLVTAGFLCKHLLIDWRWGEAYFAQKLFDYEQSSNVGNWQWAAGSGVDAAPYFRIFNPMEQAKKFDKDQEYIRKFVPEINDLSYPEPMVDHKEARERCLRVYKEALR